MFDFRLEMQIATPTIQLIPCYIWKTKAKDGFSFFDMRYATAQFFINVAVRFASLCLVASRVGRASLLFASGPNRAICPAAASARHEYVKRQNTCNEGPSCSSAYKSPANRLLASSTKTQGQ